MPRSASQPQDDALQGNLFVAPEPAAPIARTSEPETASLDLSDDELGADAAARPRQRKASATDTSSDEPTTSSSEPSSDETAWAHHSQVNTQQLTPMLRHYVELKTAHPAVLLYRLGDFFECFFEDAIELSRVLELTLTGKEGGKAVGRVPMAGIPHHSAERYCAELIKQGYSVALASTRNHPHQGRQHRQQDITGC